MEKWHAYTPNHLEKYYIRLSNNAMAVIGSDIYLAVFETSYASVPHVMAAKYWKNGVSVNLTDGTKNSEALAIAVSGSDDICGRL